MIPGILATAVIPVDFIRKTAAAAFAPMLDTPDTF